MTTWTVDDIAARFADAAETARRLPRVRVQGYFNVWPAFVREQWESLASDERVYRPFPPSPAAIDRMMETMKWVVPLTVDERHLVWMRADGYEWHQIGKRFGCERTTAWRRWQRALGKVAQHLSHTESGVIASPDREIA